MAASLPACPALPLVASVATSPHGSQERCPFFQVFEFEEEVTCSVLSLPLCVHVTSPVRCLSSPYILDLLCMSIFSFSCSYLLKVTYFIRVLRGACFCWRATFGLH